MNPLDFKNEHEARLAIADEWTKHRTGTPTKALQGLRCESDKTKKNKKNIRALDAAR